MARRAKRWLGLFLALVIFTALLPDSALAEGSIAPAQEAEQEGLIRAADPEQPPETEGGGESVPVDEEHFPDEELRAYVRGNLDTDGDGVLSRDERAAVTELRITGMDISSLAGIEFFPALEALYCDNNGLEELDGSGNPNLQVLSCSFNALVTLDLSGNPALTQLNCQYNSLEELNVSGNAALQLLSCYCNGLEELDLSENQELQSLYCNKNALSSLDLSLCPFLADVFLNGTRNEAAGEVRYRGTDGVWHLSFDLGVEVVTEREGVPLIAENFPDAVFRGYVKAHFDADGDHWLNAEEQAAVTQLDVSDLGIGSLKGVEYFPALQFLLCVTNALEELDVSANPALTLLECQGNCLTALDVSANPKLETLRCGENALAALDLSANPGLQRLSCGGNALTALDLSANPEITSLFCPGNALATLELGTKPELGFLDCRNNRLAALDLSGCPGLHFMVSYGNSLARLDVSACPLLAELYQNGQVYDEDEAFITYYDEDDINFQFAIDRGQVVITRPQNAVVLGKSLSLQGKIALNFYLHFSEAILADEGAYVTINGVKYPVKDAELREVRGGESGYRFTVQVKFAQLTDEYVLRVFSGADEPVELLDAQDGDLTETGLVYRAQDYIEYVRANSEDAGLLAVVNALSDLGSLAQAQFSYKADCRAEVAGDLDAVTAEMLAGYAPVVTAADNAGVSYFGSSLLLQDVTTLRRYFKVKDDAISGYTFTVDGVEVTPVHRDGYFGWYYVDITGITARDLDRSFRVEVSDADGAILSLDCSALSYAYQQLGTGAEGTLTDLVKAVFLYHAAADAYFTD